MDWSCTCAYVKAIAAHFGSPLYYSWKVGGFEREMLRENARTAPVRFETPGGHVGGTGGKLGTRRKFPQFSADMRVRWCSGYLHETHPPEFPDKNPFGGRSAPAERGGG